jgi:type II secretory pathway pseudopilin PulG
MKTALQIFLVLVIVALGTILILSVRKPIDFDKEKDKRYSATIERLEDIRTAQESYKIVHGHFTPSFDELVNFVTADSFEVQSVTKIKEYNTDSIPKKEAIKLGFYKISTSKVSIKDSLFKETSYPIENMSQVPFVSDAQFFMDTATVLTGSGVAVPVFEAHVKNHILLEGLDEQLAINFNDRWKQIAGDFSGLRVGSLVEATNNAGNW